MSFPAPESLLRRTQRKVTVVDPRPHGEGQVLSLHASARDGLAVVTLRGLLHPNQVQPVCDHLGSWARDVEALLLVCRVGGLVHPDAVAVDALARLRVTLARIGCSLYVAEPCARLQDVMDLMGLCHLLPVLRGSDLESRGKTKEREELGCVEEEDDPRDPGSGDL